MQSSICNTLNIREGFHCMSYKIYWYLALVSIIKNLLLNREEYRLIECCLYKKFNDTVPLRNELIAVP